MIATQIYFKSRVVILKSVFIWHSKFWFYRINLWECTWNKNHF